MKFRPIVFLEGIVVFTVVFSIFFGSITYMAKNQKNIKRGIYTLVGGQ